MSQWLKTAEASKLKEGYLDYAGKRVLNVMVSSTLIERCAILFDALIKEGEAEGYSWKINTEGKTIVTVNDEPIAVRLMERLDKQSPQERKNRLLPLFSVFSNFNGSLKRNNWSGKQNLHLAPYPLKSKGFNLFLQ